jgi:hypothetical protein
MGDTHFPEEQAGVVKTTLGKYGRFAYNSVAMPAISRISTGMPRRSMRNERPVGPRLDTAAHDGTIGVEGIVAIVSAGCVRTSRGRSEQSNAATMARDMRRK